MKILLSLLIIAAVSCQTKPKPVRERLHNIYCVNDKDTLKQFAPSDGIWTNPLPPGTYHGWHYDSTLKADIVYYTPGKDIIIKDNTFIFDSSSIREADSFGISIEAPNNNGTVIGSQTNNK